MDDLIPVEKGIEKLCLFYRNEFIFLFYLFFLVLFYLIYKTGENFRTKVKLNGFNSFFIKLNLIFL